MAPTNCVRNWQIATDRRSPTYIGDDYLSVTVPYTVIRFLSEAKQHYAMEATMDV